MGFGRQFGRGLDDGEVFVLTRVVLAAAAADVAMRASVLPRFGRLTRACARTSARASAQASERGGSGATLVYHQRSLRYSLVCASRR